MILSELNINSIGETFNFYFFTIQKLMYWESAIQPLLKNLNNVENLELISAQLPILPEAVYGYKNLKVLKIDRNDAPITLDERFCELNNLEELHFDYTLVNFPDCLHKLNKVKK